MKFLLVSIAAILAVFPCQPTRGGDTKPVMQQIGEEIHQVTKERAFTNDDAARVARHIYESLGGPIPGKGFADVTEPDAKHVEVNVGYDTGLVAISYHIRFWREPDKHQDVYVENILLAPHNI